MKYYVITDKDQYIAIGPPVKNQGNSHNNPYPVKHVKDAYFWNDKTLAQEYMKLDKNWGLCCVDIRPENC